MHKETKCSKLKLLTEKVQKPLKQYIDHHGTIKPSTQTLLLTSFHVCGRHKHCRRHSQSNLAMLRLKEKLRVDML